MTPRSSICLIALLLLTSAAGAQLTDAQIADLKRRADTPGVGFKFNFRPAAINQLAAHYWAAGDYEQAIVYLKRHEFPFGICGVGMEEELARVDYRIAQCLMRLGRTDEAIEKHLLPRFLANTGTWRGDQWLTLHYETQGKLHELEKLWADAALKVPAGAPRHEQPPHDVFELRRMKHVGDAKGLAFRLYSGTASAPRLTPGIALAGLTLAELRDAALPALREHVATMRTGSYGDATIVPVLLALKLIDTPAARAYLAELRQAADAPDAMWKQLGLAPEAFTTADEWLREVKADG